MKTITVFIIQAYQNMTDTGVMSDVTTLELIDTSYEKALERARKLVDKPFFRLHGIIEKNV